MVYVCFMNYVLFVLTSLFWAFLLPIIALISSGLKICVVNGFLSSIFRVGIWTVWRLFLLEFLFIV